MSDNEIVRLLREAGAEQAFDAIVKAYSGRLYWHVRRLVCSHEDTDDLLQEIFMKVWAALPSFRAEAQLFTWLYRIATNETLNFLAGQKVRSVLQFKSLTEEMERKIDEDPYFNGDELQRALSKAIQTLPQKQRAVFHMRYFEDLSYEHISEITGSSIGALKSSYHIAYEKIKAILKNKLTGD